MQGSREYNGLLETGQVGRLFIETGSHARGTTLHIYVLPEGAKVPEGARYLPTDMLRTEVYGVTGGQPGWTESYGWLHRGPWVADFERHVAERQAIKDAADKKQEAARLQREREENQRKMALLATYPGAA